MGPRHARHARPKGGLRVAARGSGPGFAALDYVSRLRVRVNGVDRR